MKFPKVDKTQHLLPHGLRTSATVIDTSDQFGTVHVTFRTLLGRLLFFDYNPSIFNVNVDREFLQLPPSSAEHTSIRGCTYVLSVTVESEKDGESRTFRNGCILLKLLSRGPT